MVNIVLPHNFTYREYQKPQFIASAKGINRFYKVWHRRAGKDVSDINFEVMKSMERVGNYWHMLPEYNQARKAIWEGKTKDGQPYLGFFPNEIIQNIRRQEMQIELKNGSIWRLVGSDNIDSSVGSGPVGVTFSEFALTDPRAWPYVEPMLLENGGWASFNTTPRGKNHAYDLWIRAQKNPKWFTQLLTIEDTTDLNGLPIVTQEMIEELRRMGTDEETIQQEYYCSWEGSLQGAYYAEVLKWLEENNRITNVPHDPRYPVRTYWDIGRSDYTAIWFVQKVGFEYRVIGYFYGSGLEPDKLAEELKRRRYTYEFHEMPHDGNHVRQGMGGRSLKQQMQDLMPNEEFRIGSKTDNKQADITITRSFMRRCYFDKENCADGLNALKNYVKKWSDERNMYLDDPLHNWASNGADAFRYFAIDCFNESMPIQPDSKGLPTFNAALKMSALPQRRI